MPNDVIAELSIDGAPIGRVERVSGRAAISELFRYTVRAHDGLDEGKAIPDLLGKAFELKLMGHASDPVTISGIVVRVSRSEDASYVYYDLELGPEVEQLTVGLNSFVFQEMSGPDIIKAVLQAGGIAADGVTWQLEGSHQARVYVQQYQESDWAFIERIAASEGIYYCFEHADGATKLVFSDSSSSAPTIQGDATIPFRTGTGMRSEMETVERMGRRVRVCHDAVRLTDYNPATATTKLDEVVKDGDGKYELYSYPGLFADAAAGKTRAQNSLDALRSNRVTVEGRAHTARIHPGLQFSVSDHPLGALDATYFCTLVEIDAFSGSDGRGSLISRWRAVPSETPYRTDVLSSVREMPGPQTGIMCGPPGKELHVDDTGHIRVQFYWDREGKKDDKASTWMRVGQFALGGSMVLPRVGWDLLVEHHSGLTDAPFVSGHLYDGEHPPPYALPANKTRTSWQTATSPGDGTSNEIRFEDKAGSEEIFINASKDMAVTVGDNKKKQVGVDHSHEIGANHDIKVGTDSTLSVGADQKVTVGAAETLTITGNAETVVTGSNTCSIGAARTVTATSGVKVESDGGKTLTVGASMMDVAALGVSRAVLGSCSVTVGAAWISAAAMGLSNATVGSSAETVGGAKLQLGGGGVGLKVKGALAETVGGAYVAACGGNLGETADGNLTISVGGAFLANAPDVEFEAESEIVITCGGSSITIKSSSIEVKSPSLASPGATIAKDGSQVHHNA